VLYKKLLSKASESRSGAGESECVLLSSSG
jgi:hypothetical protein